MQNFPTSAQVIYQTLSADPVFMASIGHYDFRSGQGPIDAISVTSPGEDLPALRNVEGVECIIHDTGSKSQRMYLTESSDVKTSWGMYLVSWAPSTGADLDAVANRVLQRFHGAIASDIVTTPEGLGSLVQCSILISSENPIVPL